MRSSFDEIMSNVPKTKQSVITILTDFGTSDGFIGVMKGVMLQIAPSARLVDISHDLPVFSVQSGAFLNQWSYGYYPQGTVHLCVVDPGVGTSRRMLAVEVSGHYFVAPDNGVLSPILRINENKKIISITNSRFWMDKISHTFHGRDIFSPVAAHLAEGIAIEKIGDVISDPILIPEPKLEFSPNRIVCQIEYIDRFGNLITTLSDEKYLEWVHEHNIQVDYIEITVGQYSVHGISSSYGEKQTGEMLAVFDGYNRLEVSVNQGSAQERTQLQHGDDVVLSIT